MLDRRDEILKSEFGILSYKPVFSDSLKACIKSAMDENGKRMCLELLEYMARCQVKCTAGITEPLFYYKNEWISSKEMFENFI